VRGGGQALRLTPLHKAPSPWRARNRSSLPSG
jgi:hypothetical protein